MEGWEEGGEEGGGGRCPPTRLDFNGKMYSESRREAGGGGGGHLHSNASRPHGKM